MSNDLINYLTPSLEHFHMGGYWIAFFAALLETTVGIGLIIPGSTIILFLGALSARGYLDVGDLIWFSVLGAILGDNVNYHLGKKYGAGWLEHGFWLLKVDHFEKARQFFDIHGAKGIFLGRFIPSVKEVVPFIAGSLKMNQRTFMIWNVLGAIGWGCEWVFAGFIFAQSINLAQLWLSRAGVLLGFFLLLGSILYILKWLIIQKGQQYMIVSRSLFQSIKQAVAQNEHVLLWAKEHPRSITFLSARFNRSVFTGLPLTMLMIAFVYILALLAGIVEDFIMSDPIIAVDIRVANLIPAFRTDILTTVFSWITLLGKSQVILLYIFTLSALLWIWGRRYCILPLLLVVAGSETCTYIGKIAFHRPRPEYAVYVENSFSFPSGHSTIAVAFYGFLAYVLIRFIQSWKQKVNLLFLTIILILAIGFSRIYLGEHYISDVWGGYLVGAIWLVLAIIFSEWLKQTEAFKNSDALTVGARPVSFALVAFALLFYISFALNYQPSLVKRTSTKRITVSKVYDIFTSEQLKYTETLIGEKQEPVNVVFVSQNSKELADILGHAGWTLVDKADILSFFKAVTALITNERAPSAPITPSFWNAKIQDKSFSKLSNKGSWLSNASHLRIWDTDYSINGKRVYAGMVNAISGFKWLVVPKISPDLDRQRELLYSDLDETGIIENSFKMDFVQSHIGRNFIGDQFFTDGKAYVFYLQ